jgi:ketosteroid isomerase-like protein
MSAERENVEKLRQAYQLWSDTHGESVQHWLDLMSDDVKMGSMADGQPGMEFSRSVTGKQLAKRYFADLNEAWQMIDFIADEFIAQGDQVVMRGRCCFKSRQTGKTAETPKADFVRFRNGLIVEYFEFYDTAKAFAAATPG